MGTVTLITRLTAHFVCSLMSDQVICKFRKRMVLHDATCPYWDQVSLNNTEPNHVILSFIVNCLLQNCGNNLIRAVILWTLKSSSNRTTPSIRDSTHSGEEVSSLSSTSTSSISSSSSSSSSWMNVWLDFVQKVCLVLYCNLQCTCSRCKKGRLFQDTADSSSCLFNFSVIINLWNEVCEEVFGNLWFCKLILSTTSYF